MCHSLRRRPAPSTIAASYNCTSTFVSAARKMIVPQPVSFQTVWPMIIQRNTPGSDRYLIGCPSIFSVSR